MKLKPSGTRAIEIFAAVVAVVALLLGVVLMRGVLAEEQGTEKMQEIAGAIREALALAGGNRTRAGQRVRTDQSTCTGRGVTRGGQRRAYAGGRDHARPCGGAGP